MSNRREQQFKITRVSSLYKLQLFHDIAVILPLTVRRLQSALWFIHSCYAAKPENNTDMTLNIKVSVDVNSYSYSHMFSASDFRIV